MRHSGVIVSTCYSITGTFTALNTASYNLLQSKVGRGEGSNLELDIYISDVGGELQRCGTAVRVVVGPRREMNCSGILHTAKAGDKLQQIRTLTGTRSAWHSMIEALTAHSTASSLSCLQSERGWRAASNQKPWPWPHACFTQRACRRASCMQAKPPD